MIERSSEAWADLAGHTLYLHHQAGPSVALRFLDSVESALADLEKFPYLGRVRHFRQNDLRSWPVPKFRNWLLFYRPAPGGICLYRVLHASMDLETHLGRPTPGSENMTRER
jgi:plasmid stabilization system protein ParE